MTTNVSTSAGPAFADYNAFKAYYATRIMGDEMPAEDKVQAAFQVYLDSQTPSMQEWYSAPFWEQHRWSRSVKLEQPAAPLAEFKDVLVYIAKFALTNRLVRLDDQFKGSMSSTHRRHSTSSSECNDPTIITKAFVRDLGISHVIMWLLA